MNILLKISEITERELEEEAFYEIKERSYCCERYGKIHSIL